ncbi:MAG TPA: hypothetical protein VJT71_05730 [Pyrinomonadaceae bacterium]|nr:hypothetical protein [Pyrinomonadaceae bacterium]
MEKPELYHVIPERKNLEDSRAHSRNKNWKTANDLPEKYWNLTRDLPEKKWLTTNFPLRESEFPASLPREVTFLKSRS